MNPVPERSRTNRGGIGSIRPSSASTDPGEDLLVPISMAAKSEAHVHLCAARECAPLRGHRPHAQIRRPEKNAVRTILHRIEMIVAEPFRNARADAPLRGEPRHCAGPDGMYR